MDDRLSLNPDTIAAVSTAPGRGGIGVVRLSGPDALTIAETLCRSTLPPRQATYAGFYEPGEDEPVDEGIALYFQGPASFTGENVVELQGHGSPLVLDLLLRACCRLGARLARPGEFSERAYLNDKLDLAQAEAIADLINATTESAARGAARSLQGAFSGAIESLAEAILALRIYVEAAIDFPEEEIDFISEGDVEARLSAILDNVDAVFREARQGSLLREGLKLVIAGKPNAGKSSLLNALSGDERAIVTDIAGTTRDVLREHVQIDGMPLHIVDTAGLRESVDVIEQEGIRRAWQEMETADRILLVVDASVPGEREKDADALWPERRQRLPEAIPVTIIHNKCDLLGESPAVTSRAGDTLVSLSARDGTGLDLLKNHLKASAGYDDQSTHPFLARRRHLDALEQCRDFLLAGKRQLAGAAAGELLAEDLRLAHQCLGEITGAVSSDELLGEIFSSFCIGK